MKLYIVHVGYYEKEFGIYEFHTNFLIAAPDAKGAKDHVKNKTLFIEKNMHIDGIQEIVTVDGYNVKLEKSAEQTEKLITFNYSDVKALS